MRLRLHRWGSSESLTFNFSHPVAFYLVCLPLAFDGCQSVTFGLIGSNDGSQRGTNSAQHRMRLLCSIQILLGLKHLGLSESDRVVVERQHFLLGRGTHNRTCRPTAVTASCLTDNNIPVGILIRYAHLEVPFMLSRTACPQRAWQQFLWAILMVDT
jgi:hypothetical protein